LGKNVDFKEKSKNCLVTFTNEVLRCRMMW
jgi:hypothetical protein